MMRPPTAPWDDASPNDACRPARALAPAPRAWYYYGRYIDHRTRARTPAPVMSADDIERLLPLTPLSLAILLGLADGARHGYAIMKEVERQTDGRLTPGAGSLYAALQRLLDDGLIAAAPGGGEPASARRRYYVLEQRGRAVARAELLRMARVIQLGHDRRLVPELRLAIGPVEP